MIVRDAAGGFVIHSGSGDSGAEQGTSFFLGPFEEVMEMDWSTFSDPREDGRQIKGFEKVRRIDMRARKVAYQYDVRTNDNVAMRIEGNIFWRIQNVTRLLERTSDPTSDVWYKARSTVMQAISREDLETFMSSFNQLIQNAFVAHQSDPFYFNRGIEVNSMEVTKYDPSDETTAQTLQEIVEETTNRINLLTKQRSDNAVNRAKLEGDVELERERTRLLERQTENEKLASQKEGEAEGLEMAMSASSFLDILNDTVPDVDERLSLYRMHKRIEKQNERTKLLASNKDTTLFLTPEEINFNVKSEL